MKKIIPIITVLLFSIGIASAVLLVYDHTTNEQRSDKPSLIGEKQAFDIIVRTGQWTKEKLDGKTAKLELLHIKNDGFAFFVDKKTLEEKELFFGNKFQEVQQDKYVWLAKIMDGDNLVSEYLLDASNGNVLSSSDSRFTKIELEVFGSYSPLTLKDHFLRGYLDSTSPIERRDIDIFVDDVFMGTTSTDPGGCFQFNDWDDGRLEQKFRQIIENDKKKIEHLPAELRFTAAYSGDIAHNPANATKTSHLYLWLVPLAWPSYDALISPGIIHLKKGSTTNFELTVKPNHKEAEKEHMALDLKRLPCGVSWGLTTSSGNVDSDKVTLDHPGTFHLSLGAADYARPGKYFVEIRQDLRNSNTIDPSIAGFELVILTDDQNKK